MLTTALIRKAYIPKQEKEINTIQNSVQNKNQRLRGIFKEVTTGTQYTQYTQDEARGEATLNLEGTKPDLATLHEGYSRRVFKYAWALRFKWTREVRMYSQFNVAAKGTKILGRAPENTLVAQCVALLEFGNTTSGIPVVKGMPLVNTKTIDGLSIFHATHTFKNSGVTYSNYLSSGSVDVAGLNSIFNLPYTWKRGDGAPLNLQVTRLITSYNNRQALFELLASEYDPESGDNRRNSLQEELGARDYVILSDLTTSNTVYAKTNDPEQPEIDYGWRPRTYSDRDVEIDAPMVTTDWANSVQIMSPTAMIRMGTT